MRSGLSRDAFAHLVGCGTSQLFKYSKEGLPPRMNSGVRAAILSQAVQQEVIASNAALREAIGKLSKGETRLKETSMPENFLGDAEPHEDVKIVEGGITDVTGTVPLGGSSDVGGTGDSAASADVGASTGAAGLVPTTTHKPDNDDDIVNSDLLT
jgi:hypothetical protein